MLPGLTKRRFVPISVNLCSTSALAPWPILTMAITAPTPMMMPSAVRKERILLRLRAMSEIFAVFVMFILVPLLSLDFTVS